MPVCFQVSIKFCSLQVTPIMLLYLNLKLLSHHCDKYGPVNSSRYIQMPEDPTLMDSICQNVLLQDQPSRLFHFDEKKLRDPRAHRQIFLLLSGSTMEHKRRKKASTMSLSHLRSHIQYTRDTNVIINLGTLMILKHS